MWSMRKSLRGVGVRKVSRVVSRSVSQGTKVMGPAPNGADRTASEASSCSWCRQRACRGSDQGKNRQTNPGLCLPEGCGWHSAARKQGAHGD